MKEDFKVNLPKGKDLQKRDTRQLNRSAHLVITAFEYILMLASAAFSYSFFADFFGLINIPEGLNIAIAAGLTIGQSIAIDRVMNSVVHDVLENKGFNGLSLKTYTNTFLLVGMIAFDLFANFQGIPSLARSAMKEQAEFTPPAYAGTEQMEDVEFERDAIIKRNTYKGNTFIPPADRKQYNALTAELTKHTEAKTALLANAQVKYEADTIAQQKRVVMATEFLGWFNVGAYLLMLLIVPAKHLMERENAAKRGEKATTAATDEPDILDTHKMVEKRGADGKLYRYFVPKQYEGDPEEHYKKLGGAAATTTLPTKIGFELQTATPLMQEQPAHTWHVTQQQNAATRHVQPDFTVTGRGTSAEGFPYICTWCENDYVAKRALKGQEQPFCCDSHRMAHHAEERKRKTKV